MNGFVRIVADIAFSSLYLAWAIGWYRRGNVEMTLLMSTLGVIYLVLLFKHMKRYINDT